MAVNMTVWSLMDFIGGSHGKRIAMKSGGNSLRLFQHTFGTHPEQPLPTGYKGIPFIIGVAGGLPFPGVR